MIKNLRRAAAATAFALLPLVLTTPSQAAPAAPAAPLVPLAAETLSLAAAVSRLPVTTEDRTGYNRDSFRHWNAGLNPTDGCNTRAEVLIS
ncbi:HNH endonuclease, partial [Streptomyces amakusaensis]